jgi:hypothetical protein
MIIKKYLKHKLSNKNDKLHMLLLFYIKLIKINIASNIIIDKCVFKILCMSDSWMITFWIIKRHVFF